MCDQVSETAEAAFCSQNCPGVIPVFRLKKRIKAEGEAKPARSATLSDLSVSFVVEYIMGQKTDADWESFKQSWYELGGTDWTNEVNEQYNSIVNPQ